MSNATTLRWYKYTMTESFSANQFFYVYVIQSIAESNLYIGHTTDLQRRIGEHNRGETFSTKIHRPWKLIYYEACLHEKDAERRERYLKTNQGGRLLKRRLREFLYNAKANLIPDTGKDDIIKVGKTR